MSHAPHTSSKSSLTQRTRLLVSALILSSCASCPTTSAELNENAISLPQVTKVTWHALGRRGPEGSLHLLASSPGLALRHAAGVLHFGNAPRWFWGASGAGAQLPREQPLSAQSIELTATLTRVEDDRIALLGLELRSPEELVTMWTNRESANISPFLFSFKTGGKLWSAPASSESLTDGSVLRGPLSLPFDAPIAQPGEAAQWSYRIDLRSLEKLLSPPSCALVEVYVAYCEHPHIPVRHLEAGDSSFSPHLVRSNAIRLRYEHGAWSELRD